MKIYISVVSCISLLALTGCKSLSKLTAKDHSSHRVSAGKRTMPQQKEFLEQIEVTPGAVVTSRHRTNPTNTRVAGGGNKYTAPADLSSIDIERTTFLQLKYAVIIDATVENLANIPLLETIDKWWGTRYCLGGATENCIDCSAFTQVVMRDIYNVTLARTAHEQFNNSERIELEALREGDLVFFRTTGRTISHVGIYLLNNKFVHASTSGGVMISDLNDKYWQPRYSGSGRVVR